MAACRNYENTVVSSADGDHDNWSSNWHLQNATVEADDIIKYTCNPCKESNSLQEALYYCPECQEFYCHDCMRFHRRMAKLKDHVVFGKSDEDKWGQKATQLIEKCTKHSSEIISIHCEDCNELCCHVCICLKHSDCRTKEYIPTAAKGITESTKLQRIKKKIKKTCNKADQFRSSKENSIHDLYTKQATFLQHIADMRKQVNDVFDEMEERATLGVTHFGNALRVNVAEEIDICNAVMQEMNPLVENLKNTDNKGECQVFMDVVKAENCVKKAKGKMEKLLFIDDYTEVVDGLKFDSKTNLHHLLQEIKSFGQVSYSYIIEPSYADPIYERNYLGALIEGICQLNNGTFILADSACFRLTWLSSAYKVKGNAALYESPSAVCNTEAKQVAVSLTNKLKVFLIDKEMSHVPHKDLHFEHRCCGLAYKDKKYFISDYNSTVYVYDTNGICQSKIKTNRGRSVFQSVRNIAIGDRANKIYVTDTDKGLITLDLNGKVLSTLESKETEGSYGVCVTNDGRVFVTNYLQDNVIEVDKDGQTILQRNLVRLEAGQSPKSICYDSQNSCVLVSDNHLSGPGLLSVFKM